MISKPQGDLKHTGHVGSDGQFFGDITFLSAKVSLSRSICIRQQRHFRFHIDAKGRMIDDCDK